MCNAVSEAYSLYNDGKDVLKGNWRKLPESVIELNKILTAVGMTNGVLGRSVRGGYDYFVKNGHSKALMLGEKNTNPIAFVMGLMDCKRSKNPNKVKTYSSFVAGFSAKVAVESLMDSAKGSKVLEGFSKAVTEKTSKVLKLKGNVKEDTVKVGSFIIAGLLYPIISDKVTDVVSNFTEKIVDKIQNKRGKR